MQPCWPTWPWTVRAMTVLAVLLTCGRGGVIYRRHSKKNLPQPLPGNILAAWKKAGARVGWMRANEFGFIEFLPKNEGIAGDLPAMSLSLWNPRLMRTLPAPAVAFGLSLAGTEVTD